MQNFNKRTLIKDIILYMTDLVMQLWGMQVES